MTLSAWRMTGIKRAVGCREAFARTVKAMPQHTDTIGNCIVIDKQFNL
jgi:hypothetical protein